MRRAKREHEEKESDRLEATLQDPKKWWQLLSKKKVTSKKVAQVDLSRVIDGERKIREGDGARKVWKAHFEQLLNEGAGDVGGQRETVVVIMTSEMSSWTMRSQLRKWQQQWGR